MLLTIRTHVSGPWPETGPWDKSAWRTEGVALRLCGSGGCSIGDAERGDFEGVLATLKTGSEGVVAFDMLAWPGDDCCAPVQRGLSRQRAEQKNRATFDYCIDAASNTRRRGRLAAESKCNWRRLWLFFGVEVHLVYMVD